MDVENQNFSLAVIIFLFLLPTPPLLQFIEFYFFFLSVNSGKCCVEEINGSVIGGEVCLYL